MKKFVVVLFFLVSHIACAQRADNSFTVAFWNLENLFDTVDDPLKNDDEFLPDAVKQWNQERLERKFYNLSRVIRSMNEGRGPDLLGVCEVENQDLLETLINKYFPEKSYKALSPESPDQRSIQTGIIYDSKKLTLLATSTDTVNIEPPTRLILGVVLLFNKQDTIYSFVNHWPSRRGGEKESELKRIEAAKVLRGRIDKIFSENKSAKVIIMGDFNDEPTNLSIWKYLGAEPLLCSSSSESPNSMELDKNSNLFNLAFESYNRGEGSYKHQDNWNMLDQIIVSRELIIGKKLKYQCDSFEVFKPDFMVTKTGKFAGTPFPTYGSNNRYLGGYSDHFPVIAKFILEE